jgi:hypothetical protein
MPAMQGSGSGVTANTPSLPVRLSDLERLH